MSSRLAFSAVAAVAFLAGAGFWWLDRSHPAPAQAISPAALYATPLRAPDGRATTLGAYENQVLVVNFWATWCAPCREEMPAFSRLNDRWASKGVRFVGLSDEEPAQVAAFARERPVSYPLWTGGDAVGELARRLGNRLGVLPFTVVLERGGRVLESRVGPYTEQELESRLAAIATNSVKR